MTGTLKNVSPEAEQWARTNFEDSFSSDIRRKERIIEHAAKMKDSPGESIPQRCESAYEVKATYNMLKHPETTPDSLQRGHVSLVKEKLLAPGSYLLIEDDSEFSWNGKQPIEGLGPSGSFREGQQGFMLHTTLAARWEDGEKFQHLNRPPLEFLGIADQQFYLRQPAIKRTQRQVGGPCTEQFKETDPWFHSMTRIGEKPKCDDINWIRVCDRRADIFEQFEWSKEFGHDFVIRSAQDRVLESSLEGTSEPLSSYVKSLATSGIIEIKLRGRNGLGTRIAQLALSAAQVTFRPPWRKGIKKADQKSYTCNVVYVREVGDVPEGTTPIEWTLLTSLDVSDLSLTKTVVRIYYARWVIEEFHKVLKSGLKAEDLQVKHADRLFAEISIMSVVAVSLVDLREIARRDPTAPAEESNLDELELEVLARRIERELYTVSDVVMAIGRLGGHMNRKKDGFPGVITLWRGWNRLKTMCEGARLFKGL